MGKVNTAFLIGRFQPFHNGHKHLIDYGLEHAEKVVVLVGGSNKARSAKNPWTFEEREKMIESAYADINDDLETSRLPILVNRNKQRVFVEPLPDVPGNDDAWLGNVYEAVNKHMDEGGDLGVIGFKKDDSSYYLDLFPTAERIILDEGFATLSATEIRDHYFQKAPVFPAHLVPPTVEAFLVNFYQYEHLSHWS